MPLPELTKTIDLGPVGAPEFTVTFKRMAGIPYEEMQRIFGNQKTQLSPEKLVEKRFSQLIIEWNIMDYNGKPYPLPKDKPKVTGTLPSAFVDFIGNALLEDAAGSVKEEEAVPLVEKSEVS